MSQMNPSVEIDKPDPSAFDEWLVEASEQRLRKLAELTDFLDDWQRENGALTQEELEAARAEWPD